MHAIEHLLIYSIYELDPNKISIRIIDSLICITRWAKEDILLFHPFNPNQWALDHIVMEVVFFQTSCNPQDLLFRIYEQSTRPLSENSKS